IGFSCATPVAEHVREVLGELRRAPQPRAGPAARVAVEGRAAVVAGRGRHGPVGELAGDQLHLRAGLRECRAQRVVVRRRERRGVDDVDADHRRRGGGGGFIGGAAGSGGGGGFIGGAAGSGGGAGARGG